MRISDLKKIFRNAYKDYSTLANGIRLYQLSTAITANSTTTTAPEGSVAVTSHSTGRGMWFYSDGTKWQAQVTGATTKASGSDINTGTDDAKFVTAKAIADSTISKATKASGAEIITGTDDAKFATAKALADARVVLLPETLPEVSAEPTEQGIVDALVTLGLVTQAEA